jgi:nicotinamide mononucleotide transporter
MYLYFASKTQSIAWLFGICASVLSTVYFYQLGYFGSAVLNVIYAIQGVLGFVQWQWYLSDRQVDYFWNRQQHIGAVLIVVFISVLGILLCRFYHFNGFNSLDIVLAAFSILATYLESKKDISCWNYWIVCNLAYALLYLYSSIQKPEDSMYLYSSLMLGLAVFSYYAKRAWLKSLTIKSESI